jgi:DNA/RNA-binding domain of Phe-tRNA-synthetase-like protein
MSDARRGQRCKIGILALESVPGGPDAHLRAAKRQLEETLREKFGQTTREELKAPAPFAAYAAYYRAFGDTYHVLPQLESVVRGKPVPEALPPVTSMFMAELKNGILTAGHDLGAVRLPLRCRHATGEESYTTLGGRQTRCVAGDWLIEDREGVLSSILRGPDQRTAINGATARLIYTAYAPEGVSEAALTEHLRDVEAFVRLFSDFPGPGFRKIVRADSDGAALLDAGEF